VSIDSILNSLLNYTRTLPTDTSLRKDIQALIKAVKKKVHMMGQEGKATRRNKVKGGSELAGGRGEVPGVGESQERSTTKACQGDLEPHTGRRIATGREKA
jgi:hypothetical protein